MKFGQLKEYSTRKKIFLKNHTQNDGVEGPNPFMKNQN